MTTTAGSTLYALVINDRHRDTEVRLFTDPKQAMTALIEHSRGAGWPLDLPTPERWLMSCAHPTESDNAHVAAVTVEA